MTRTPINLQVRDKPAGDAGPRVVCLMTSPWLARHVLPLAHAGGWQVVTQVNRQDLSGALVVCPSHGHEMMAMRAGAMGTVHSGHGTLSYCGPEVTIENPWHGSRGRCDGRKLLLCSSKELAERHLKVWPNIPVAVVGAPNLDRWHGQVWTKAERPKVCVSTHWDCSTSKVPETRSSWPWLKDALPALAQDPRWELCGHWHPQEEQSGSVKERKAFFAAHGIRPIRHFDDVLAGCDLFITDNSTTLYEFAAVGKPVVAVNPPWYRPEAQHGLRFWSHVPGLQVNDLARLNDAVAEALADAPKLQRLRKRAVAACYGKLDGKASERAANAIRARFAELVQAGKTARNF